MNGVLNDTGDYYCFFDATAHAEFLYKCVGEAVTRDLPQEVAYLEGYAEFARRVQEEAADMPERTIALLVRFLWRSDGRLPSEARLGEFRCLSADEVERVEEQYKRCFAAAIADPARMVSASGA